MLDKETFIKRETEVEERKILDWCGTIFKELVGGAIVLTPLTMFYCICIRNFGKEPAIICMSLVLLLLVLAIVLAFVFEFSNKIAYRKACKSWKKEHKIQEKRKKDEDRAIENFKFLILFDIVRKKNVSACLIQCCKTPKEYNSCPGTISLTQEEFDLAKEILG
jgi:uncharacterized membrane protein